MTTPRPAIALFVVIGVLAGCVSATDCAEAIPAQLRADAVRFVIDRRLAGESLIPEDERISAMSTGTPYREMSQERRRLIAPYAAGYASCVSDLSSRSGE